MTGRYPARIPVGLMEPLTQTSRDSAYGLTSEYPSIASLLKSVGYKTALIGKWHLGFRPEHSPIQNGFDYFFGIHSGAADYISHKGDSRRHDLYENDLLVYPEGYLTDLITQKAISFINLKHTRPFFLTINYNAPHWPWQGPSDTAYHDTMSFRKGGSASTYASMMKSLDDGIGNIMKALDDAGLSGRTIIIFTNDNGGERFSDNGGLSQSKGTLWEGGIRVPAFVRWPGHIKPATVTDQVAITMDWNVTILRAAGENSYKFNHDGLDLMPVLTGKKKNTDRILYWRTTQRTRHKAIRSGKWKYLQEEKGEYLFDLSQDPGEKNDLQKKEPAVLEKLKKEYAAWEKTVLIPIPL